MLIYEKLFLRKAAEILNKILQRSQIAIVEDGADTNVQAFKIAPGSVGKIVWCDLANPFDR